jgi:hypothetical protein
MSVPIMLDPPPVVTQTAQTCWAAAFESWSAAIAQLTGLPSERAGAQQLIDWFERGHGLVRPDGRATHRGIGLVAGIGLMDLQRRPARQVTVNVLGSALEHGHLYISYFSRPGRAAHAVVCYGVDAQSIHVMDPMPGAGLTAWPAAYFLHWPQGWAVIGTSLVLDLTRGAQRSIAQLGP